MTKYLLTAISVLLLFAASVAHMQTSEEEPIAYIGHGGFFTKSGNQIEVTLEFVARAQQWYRAKLLSNLNANKKAEFAKIEQQLDLNSQKTDLQSSLVVQSELLDWLIANSDSKVEPQTIGKLNALKYELRWKLPASPGVKNFKYGEDFKVDPAIEQKLRSIPSLRSFDFAHARATLNRRQAYIDECRLAGVPIPPPIGQLDPAGTSGWRVQGAIAGRNLFIENSPADMAEVRTYLSSSPAGMCIALPRYVPGTYVPATFVGGRYVPGGGTVKLDGVICLGQTSSKVCFWDNQMMGRSFPFPIGDVIPIGVSDPRTDPMGRYQAGGAELEIGAGGMCSDCHAGQNPYIIHPQLTLLPPPPGPTLMGNLNTGLPTFSLSRYDPLVKADWAQNGLSQTIRYVPAACSGCHQADRAGGAFPHLSDSILGYCGILNKSIGTLPPPRPGELPNPPPTMPLGSPGSLACTPYLRPTDPGFVACTPEIAAFLSWCGVAATSDPSDRGDPHLTTTNGIQYDFQAAGEFTALRNSATDFELQTRQTGVSTNFTPAPHPYTGLASCVSLNTAVAVRLGGHRITYQPVSFSPTHVQLPQLRLDGRLVRLMEAGIDLGGGNLITPADLSGAVKIKVSDGTVVIISPSFWADQGYWHFDIEVLNTPAREGTMGHILLGDWLPLGPDGSSFGPVPMSLAERHVLLNHKFADAWRVTDVTSLFDYEPGISTENFTNRDWPPKPGQPCTGTGGPALPVKPIKSEDAKKLCSIISDTTAFENCMFDVITTGNTRVPEAYQRSLRLREIAIRELR
jgi:hypothetical protein